MSWLDRLRGGFQKTAERVADNLTGLTSRAALDTATLDDIEEALIASDLGPEASHRIREAIAAAEVRAARRARPSHDPRRGDREDPRAGRQAAGNLGLSAPARDPGDRRQRLGQDDHHRQARPLAEGAGLWRPARRRRHLPRRRDRAAADLGRPHRRAGHLRQGRRRRGRDRLRRRQAGDRDRRGRADRRHRRPAPEQDAPDGGAVQDPPRARPPQPRSAARRPARARRHHRPERACPGRGVPRERRA